MKQNPSLIVAAQPVSTYVDPGKLPTAGLELYDEQQVRLALEFSDSFSSLSTTAARIAGQLKEQSNKEDFEAGKDLVRQNQKSYISLVEEGKIKPSENPWLALGAQEASGLVEGMKARREFQEYYNKKAAQDPKFFDDSTGFDALASSFVMNKEAQFKDSVFLSRSFHESFDSFVPQMALSHENEVVKRRVERVVGGIDASTLQLVDNLYILNNKPSPELNGYFSIPEAIRRPIEELQKEYLQSIEQGTLGYINDFVGSLQSAEAAIGRAKTNKSVIDYLISLRAEGTYSKEAKYLMENLSLGTGLLFETEDAKSAVAANWPRIVAGDQKYTDDKRKQYNTASEQLLESLREEDKIGEAAPLVTELHGALVNNLGVNGELQEQLTAQFGKALNAIIEDTKTKVVSSLITSFNKSIEEWVSNSDIVGTDIEESAILMESRNAFLDSLSLVAQGRGLVYTEEDMLKIAAQVDESFRKAAKNARDSQHISRADRAFTEAAGGIHLKDLEQAFSRAISDPSNIGVAAFNKVSSSLDNFNQSVAAAKQTAEDPAKQAEIERFYYRKFKQSILPILSSLDRAIKDNPNLYKDQTKYFEYTAAAESVYSFGLDMASRTGDTNLFSVLTFKAKNAISSYDPKNAVDPMTSAIIRSLGNVTEAQLEAVEKRNQNWEEIDNIVRLIRQFRNYGNAFSPMESEKDVIKNIQDTMQRAGTNLITSQPQARLSFDQQTQLKNLFKSKAREEDLNPAAQDSNVSLMLSYASRGFLNSADTWDTDILTWSENSIDAFEQDFLLFRDGSYINKKELINAFVEKDSQTGASVLPRESDAALNLDILMTHHPDFKDYPGATIVVSQYPTIQDPEFKYSIVTESGDPLVDRTMSLEEIVRKYWVPRKAQLLIDWRNSGWWQNKVNNTLAPLLPRIAPIIPIPVFPTLR